MDSGGGRGLTSWWLGRAGIVHADGVECFREGECASDKNTWHPTKRLAGESTRLWLDALSICRSEGLVTDPVALGRIHHLVHRKLSKHGTAFQELTPPQKDKLQTQTTRMTDFIVTERFLVPAIVFFSCLPNFKSYGKKKMLSEYTVALRGNSAVIVSPLGHKKKVA